jgi:hypothetical protein
MLELEDVLAERCIHQLGVPVGERSDETGALKIVLDSHPGSGERERYQRG